MTGKIRLISSDRGILRSVMGSSLSTSQSANLGAVLGVKKQVTGDDAYKEKVDYFVSRINSDNNGNIEGGFKLTISGAYISVLTVAFDDYNNNFPTVIYVDGVKHYNENAIFTVATEENYYHIVQFDNWNKPNAPVVITGIYVDIDIELNRRNLIDLETTIFDRSDYTLPSYGIISNTGNLTFNDTNGEIKDYAEQGLLTSDLKVEITLADTLTKKSEQIAVMETSEWDYDNDSKTVSVSLQDDLVEWQDIQTENINYDPRNPFKTLPNRNMADLYAWLHERTPSKYNMVSFNELDEKTQDILTNTTVLYPFLYATDLWSQWTKLCQVCALYIYKDKDKTLCNYTYGS